MVIKPKVCSIRRFPCTGRETTEVEGVWNKAGEGYATPPNSNFRTRADTSE